MMQSHGSRLALVMALGFAAWSAALLAKGVFVIDMHEGDTLHLLDMVMRMVRGEMPHLDFMTPIGILAVWPIAGLMAAGLGAGMAILAAQVAVAACLFPAVLRVAASRFSGLAAHAYALFVIGLVLAVIHGESARVVSISMHYNRWAWALAYIAIPLALLPARGRPREGLDGALVGLAFAGLALTKMTYFIAFFPPVALALLIGGRWRMILAALVAGLGAAAALTAHAGLAFWGAYARDLLTVAGSESRAMPGDPLDLVVSGPDYLVGSIALALSVVILRQTPQKAAGLCLLLLFPAFVYVTWQNWGNDPQWINLFAFLVLALRPEAGAVKRLGWDLRQALTLIAVAAFANAAPSTINVLASPFYHASREDEDRVPLITGDALYADLLGEKGRYWRRYIRMPADGPGTGLEDFAARAKAEKEEEPPVLAGETLPDCSTDTGHTAVFTTVARDLEAAGYGGSAIFGADLLSGFWLFGDFRPLPGGAPWHYDGLPGIGNADYVLVPACPLTPSVRDRMARAINEAGIDLIKLRETPLYTLYRPEF